MSKRDQDIAILTDLKEFLQKETTISLKINDDRSDMVFLSAGDTPNEVFPLFFYVCNRSSVVAEDSIHIAAEGSIEVVSLVDPKYREKVLKHYQNIRNQKQMLLKT